MNDTARRSRNQTLPLLQAMEERAGERRRVCGLKLECPSPRSSPHSSVVGRGRKILAAHDDSGLLQCREAITRPASFQNCPAEPPTRVNVCQKPCPLLPAG